MPMTPARTTAGRAMDDTIVSVFITSFERWADPAQVDVERADEQLAGVLHAPITRSSRSSMPGHDVTMSP